MKNTMTAQLAILVFGFDGSDLFESKPLPYTADGQDRQFAYWYDGLPDWDTGIPETYDTDDGNEWYEYVTVVYDCLYGYPPDSIEMGGEMWDKIDAFQVCAERECPCKEWDEHPEMYDENTRCVYCECKKGEEHGYVYLGEGWCEVVYRKRVAID